MEIARRGIKTTGVDFASEMIRIAKGKVSEDIASNVSFNCVSIFDFETFPAVYDVISANGFIEYISLAEFRNFLMFSHRAIAPGGSLVFSSRNRLFNLFSLNSYTQTEIEGEALKSLLRESIAIASGQGVEDLLKLETVPLQDAEMAHGKSRITVLTRFQYTPVQLMRMLDE